MPKLYVRGYGSPEDFGRDFRYGARSLRRNLTFTLVAVFTLALGIGANTVIFSAVNAVLLRSLPYEDADRLVMIWGNFLRLDIKNLRAKAAEYHDYKEQTHVFDDVAAFSNTDFTSTANDAAAPERIPGALVTSNLFPLLGAQAFLGRTFSPEENQPGHDDVVILSYAKWQSAFGSDRAIIGRTLNLNNRSYKIIGVMPSSFQFPHQSFPFAGRADVWVPSVYSAEQLNNRAGPYGNFVIARLKTNVTLEQSRAEMDNVARDFERQYRSSYRGPKGEDGGWRITVVPLLDEVLVGNTRLAMLVLLGAVGCVLLIACTNVANLSLARGAIRRKEMAVRAALGASWWRIMRQMLTESLLLATLAGTAGLVFAWCGIKLLIALSPENIPRLTETSIDYRVLAFTAAISLLTALLFGVMPALQISRLNLAEAFKEGSRSTAGGIKSKRLNHLLVVSEVALALVLLVGAGLLLKSFHRLRQTDFGFDSHNVITLRLSLSGAKYAEGYERAAFFRRFAGELETIPGAQSVSYTANLPLSGIVINDPITVEGRPFDLGNAQTAAHQTIGARYFQTMKIPLLEGRDFSNRDDGDSEKVAIINEHMARTFWPTEDVIGKKIKLGGPQPSNPWITIIGVVGNSYHDGFGGAVVSDLYLPYLQAAEPDMYVVVRTAIEPLEIAPSIRARLNSIDKDQPIVALKTMDRISAESVAPQRFQLILVCLFAGLAMIITAVGIYGVIAYTVTQRRHEIGIRMALGAQKRDVMVMVVSSGLKLALAGACLGLILSAAVTRAMRSMLYGVSATDPVVYAIVTMILICVALFASYLPAYRATKVEPNTALRYE